MTSFYHHLTMRLWLVAFLVTTCGLAAGAVPASAAKIRVDRQCFADPVDREDTVLLTGSGFTPNAAYEVVVGGLTLAGGSGRTDAAGGMSGRFVAPSVATATRTQRQHTFRLSVREGANRPETTFTVSRLFASFTPPAGDPASLRVRFELNGFALLGAPRPPVYVHYVSPRGRLARTTRLGTAASPCGALHTTRRRLFGFTPRPGRWRLQFDTRERYTPATARSAFLFYSVAVRVR